MSARRFALILVCSSWFAPWLDAADRNWVGTTSTDFENAANWGGILPQDDLTTDKAKFSGALTTFQPRLSRSRQLNGLKFESHGWVLDLNSFTLTLGNGGIATKNAGGSQILGGTLALGASQAFNTDQMLLIGATITGASTFTLKKQGAADLILSGANTYAGLTDIEQGRVVVLSDGALGSTTNGTTVAAGSALGFDANVNYSQAEALTINGSGLSSRGALENMNGNNSFAGAITLSGNASIGSTEGTLTLTGAINNNGQDLTARGAGDLVFSGVVSGAGKLIKTGAGTLTLSGSNTYADDTNVQQGRLIVTANGALGSTVKGTNVTSGASLGLSNVAYTSAETLTLNGTGLRGAGALENVSGSSSFAGAITFGSDTTIGASVGTLSLSSAISLNHDLTFTGAGNTNVTGVVSNNHILTKTGSGTLTLSAANTYTGTTVVNSGTLRVTGSLNGTTGTALTFTGTGTFDSNEAANRAQGMGALTFTSGNGTVQSTYGGSGNTSLTFSSLTVPGAGATANFVVSGGTNGTTNKISITGLGAGRIGAGVYFGGDDFAWNDAGGFVREIDYGFDAGTTLANGGASLTGNHVKTTGDVTAQTTQSFDTLHIENNINFNLASGQTLTVNGILKTGNVAGGATITGGTRLQADLNANIFVRAAETNDSIEIVTPIEANGTNALTISGLGTVTLSGANTYTGGTYVNSGLLQIGANDRLSNSGAVIVNGGTFGVQTFNETVGAVTLISGAITGTGTLTGTSYDVRSGSAGAILGGTGALTKSTDGTVTLTGGNTYSGATVINGGNLVAAAPAGSALGGTSAITVNTGGILTLGADNQIRDAANITLDGGTLVTTGFDEGSATATGIATLNLTGASMIDFGTGDTSTLAFAIFNPGGHTLTIDDWTGTPGVIGDASTDRLIFATNPAAFLDQFIFTGFSAGSTSLPLPSGYYEITPNISPVPEMNPALLAGLLCGAGIYLRRRAARKRARSE